MSTKAGRPPLKVHVVRKQEPNYWCKKIHLVDGKAAECGAETNGRTYCRSCWEETGSIPMGASFTHNTLSLIGTTFALRPAK